MRFAYIDSQGKEVPIPGADALRLRIELGAIVGTTEFYDASTDRWAPAAEHEIFRTLKREVEGSEGDGFVAPPPTPVPTPEQPSADQSPGVVEEPGSGPIGDMGSEPEIAGVDEFAPDPTVEPGPTVDPVAEASQPTGPEPSAEEAGAAEEDLDFDMGGLGGLTLAEEPEDHDEAEDVDVGADEVQPVEPSSAEAPPPEDLPEPTETPHEDFDFGSFGALELEEEPVSSAEPSVEEEPLEAPEAPGTPAPESEAGAPAGRWDVSADISGLEPESDPGEELPEEETETPTVDEGLEVEGTSMADYDPDEPPSWMAKDEPEPEPASPGPGVPEAGLAAAGTAAAAGPVPDDEGAPPPESERPRDPYDRTERPNRSRSGPPQRKLTPKGSGGAGKLVGGLLAVVLLGGGVWFGMQMMGGGDGSAGAPAETVVLPELPTELRPQLRQLAQRASVRMVERFDSLPARLELAEGPGNDWLGGAYLANAGDFPDIGVYWRNMGELVTQMRENEDTFFEQAYRDEVAAANLTPDNADLLLERGLAGFEAAGPDRAIIYDQLQGVVDAAMDLHLFLMENEENIDFEPAQGGVSRDPLLEAVPVTESLGEEMMSRVVEITNALDALGYLEMVATEPLLEIVGEKLVATGIR